MLGEYETMIQIINNLYLYEDTCHVYVVKNEKKAILIDFGDGDVLDNLDSIGVSEVTDILLTHHHRDQGQGLQRAVDQGIRIWLPETEHHLFSNVDEHWQFRELYNNYNGRQDRFSVLQSIPDTNKLHDYDTISLNDIDFTILPTPGHTTGSISIITHLNEKRVIFSGDLIYEPGKIYSLAATQWSYNGGEGIALAILSLLSIKDRNPDLLLPSHGKSMPQPIMAIDKTVEHLRDLLTFRGHNLRLFQLAEKPYEQITPHLLSNRTSMSNAYVLLSKSGKALFIDYGYDFIGGIASGHDRASRRPWLYTIDKLKEHYKVKQVDVVIPTHFHDDHVAGLNLLQRVEGTEVWSPELFTNVLEDPANYDLPCLWYDPIKVDRSLPLDRKIEWEEYEITLSHQSGHAYHAVTIGFEVDGKKVLAVGDQYEGPDGTKTNYVYNNGFRPWDYRDSAKLYRKLNPDVILFGHRDPLWVTPEYLKVLDEKGNELEQIHNKILPSIPLELKGIDAFARISPYQKEAAFGEWTTVDVHLLNSFEETIDVNVNLVVPPSWEVKNNERQIQLSAHKETTLKFEILPMKNNSKKQERIAVDLTINTTHLGQLTEAVVNMIE